jgi:uncharacterized phage infection (PIP) family protein YhgE
MSEGPLMIILLSCMAVALCFMSFGLGLVNLTGSKAMAAPPAAPAPEPAPAPAPSEDRQDAKRNEELTARVAAQRDEVDKLKAALENQKKELERRVKELEQARNLLAKLQAQAAEEDGKLARGIETAAAQKKAAELAARELAALRERIRQARERIDAVEKKIKELREQIDKRKGEVDVTEIAPRGSGEDPQYVECLKDGVVLRPQGQQIALEQLKKKSPAFLQGIHRDFVVFLVRPQGFASFRAAHSLAAEKGLKVGYRPVEELVVVRY